VAGFVGADRGVKRLAVLTLDAAALEPVGAEAPNGPAILLGSTLRDALAHLLTAGEGRARVEDGEGRLVGVISADGVVAAARRQS